MKPVVVFVKEDGTLKLTEEELKKLIEDAYSQGFADGKEAGNSLKDWKWTGGVVNGYPTIDPSVTEVYYTRYDSNTSDSRSFGNTGVTCAREFLYNF